MEYQIHLFFNISYNYFCMHSKTMKACVIQKYGGNIQVKEFPIPVIKQGELLVKVEASTINPSDRISLTGALFKKPLPQVCGLEGTGKIVEAKGETVQHWLGKRVSFTALNSGSWAEYAVTSPITCFQISEDVPLSCAASGVTNPLTVTGFVQKFKSDGCKGGIIHTAAASSLGRMLNKLCQTEKIPLLNIVRKESHAQTLKKEGATHVIVTSEGWEEKYKEAVKKYGFDCLYDALGGGPVTDVLISNLPPTSKINIYGELEEKKFQLTNILLFFGGLKIEGFLIFPTWWNVASPETQQKVRKHYSEHLKNELKTTTAHEITLSEIHKGLELSVSEASKGKVLIRIS